MIRPCSQTCSPHLQILFTSILLSFSCILCLNLNQYTFLLFIFVSLLSLIIFNSFSPQTHWPLPTNQILFNRPPDCYPCPVNALPTMYTPPFSATVLFPTYQLFLLLTTWDATLYHFFPILHFLPIFLVLHTVHSHISPYISPLVAYFPFLWPYFLAWKGFIFLFLTAFIILQNFLSTVFF